MLRDTDLIDKCRKYWNSWPRDAATAHEIKMRRRSDDCPFLVWRVLPLASSHGHGISWSVQRARHVTNSRVGRRCNEVTRVFRIWIARARKRGKRALMPTAAPTQPRGSQIV